MLDNGGAKPGQIQYKETKTGVEIKSHNEPEILWRRVKRATMVESITKQRTPPTRPLPKKEVEKSKLMLGDRFEGGEVQRSVIWS